MNSDQSCRTERSCGHQTYRRLDITRRVCFPSFPPIHSCTKADQLVSVIPESTHQDTVGTFARTVKDAVYALDAIYGIDPRDNYTSAQDGKTPAGGYTQFLTNKDALKNAIFGLPWQSFWILADEVQQASLAELIGLIEGAGATVVNGTELRDYESIVSPDGWNW